MQMNFDLSENWIVKIHRNLQLNRQKVHPKDYTFFNVDKIEQAAKHTVKFFKSCNQCDANRQELVDLSEQFPELLQTISGRRQFTERLDKVLTHLRKQHAIYPAGYFTGLYSLLGIIFGGLIGWIVAKLKLLSMFAALTTFLPLGLIIGWIVGQVLDQKVKKQGRRL